MALKIIRNKSRFHTQAAVEIKVLRFLNDCDAEGRYNVVGMKSNFIFRSHICIAFELLHISLYDFLKANRF